MSLAERITNRLFFYISSVVIRNRLLRLSIVAGFHVGIRKKKNQSRVIQSGEQITCTYMPCWVQLITRRRLICCPTFSRVTHRDKKLRKVTANEAWQRNFNRFVYLSYLVLSVWRICPVFLSDHPVHFSLVWWFLLTIAHNLLIVRLLFLHKRHCIVIPLLPAGWLRILFRLPAVENFAQSESFSTDAQPRPTFSAT